MGCSSSSESSESGQLDKLVRAVEADDPSALLAVLQPRRDAVWRHATLTLCLRRHSLATNDLAELICKHLPRYSPPELDVHIECDGSPAVHGTEDHYSLLGAAIARVRPAASGPYHYSEQMLAAQPGYGMLCGCILRHLYWLPELAWGFSGFRSPKILLFLEGTCVSLSFLPSSCLSRSHSFLLCLFLSLALSLSQILSSRSLSSILTGPFLSLSLSPKYLLL